MSLVTRLISTDTDNYWPHYSLSIQSIMALARQHMTIYIEGKWQITPCD